MTKRQAYAFLLLPLIPLTFLAACANEASARVLKGAERTLDRVGL